MKVWLPIQDYKYKEVPLFAFLDVTLWPKEGDYSILKYSLKFIHLMSKSTDFFQSPFYIPIYLESTIIRLLIAQILTGLDPFGERFNFSIPWDLNQKAPSAIKPPE